jgi:hypothetical protein
MAPRVTNRFLDQIPRRTLDACRRPPRTINSPQYCSIEYNALVDMPTGARNFPQPGVPIAFFGLLDVCCAPPRVTDTTM